MRKKFRMPPRLQFVKIVGLTLCGIGIVTLYNPHTDHLLDVGTDYIHVGLIFWVIAMTAQGIVDEIRK